VIGTGTNPVTISDYCLQTQVTTSITHGASNVALENPLVNQWRNLITRTFTNNTGSTLTTHEVGLYSRYTYGPPWVSWLFCLDRTLFDVTVPNLNSVLIAYRISIYL
jgi:hypothetical protein